MEHEKSTGLDRNEYEKMYTAEDRYFWFVAKHRLLAQILRRELKTMATARVLDAGCGTGGFLVYVNDWTTAVGLDPEALAVEFCRRRGLKLLLRGEIGNIGLADNTFDVAVASDVVEHLTDDAGALREIYRVLAPGGMAVVTAPGMPWLWGPHDEALGHKRRYSRRGLSLLLQSAGFSDVRVFSYMSMTSPIVVAIRLLQKFFRIGDAKKTVEYKLPALANRLLLGVLGIERGAVMAGLDLLIGTTLVAVARKGSVE